MTRRRAVRRALAGWQRPVRPTPFDALLEAIGRAVPRRFASSGTPRAIGVQVVLAATGVCAGAMAERGVRAVFASAILAVGGWRWPRIVGARTAELRRRRVIDSLPDTLDLVAACVRAGSSVRRAFATAAEREPGPLGEAMREVVVALDHGVAKADAYRMLSERAGVPEVRTVASSLMRVERLGMPLAATLDALAAEMRERRRSRLEERARSAPVRMLFPVIVCFLPAFVLLTIAPVLIVAVRGFRGT